MNVLNVEQGTNEWMLARLGRPTASQFGRILTAKTRKYAAGADTYLNELVAEWLLGYPLEMGNNQWMERGVELEEEARRWYEFQYDTPVEAVGFVTARGGEIGGSPDGLLEPDGGLEIKVPAAHTHVSYLRDESKLVDAYFAQVQGYLLLTGRAWWDLVSYNPVLPQVVVRIEPDAEYQAALNAALDRFLAELKAAKDRYAEFRQPSILAEHPEQEVAHV